MNRLRLTIISVVVLFVLALCMLGSGRKVSAQNAASSPSSVYNPYPPGILPPNLNSEISRVLAEVDFLKAERRTRWRT